MHSTTDGQFKRHFYCRQLTLWLGMEARVREPPLLTKPLTAWCLNQNCLMARGKASQAMGRGVRSKASGPLFNSGIAAVSHPTGLILEPCCLSRSRRQSSFCLTMAPWVPVSWVPTRRQEQISNRDVHADPVAGVAKQLFSVAWRLSWS